MYQFTCTEQKACDNCEVQRVLHNVGSTVCNMIVNFPALRVWKRLLVFPKNVKPMFKVHPCTGTEALYRPYGP